MNLFKFFFVTTEFNETKVRILKKKREVGFLFNKNALDSFQD